MYPSRADLVAASAVAELAALTAPQQDALRAEAISAVESYCGQSFAQEGTLEAPVTRRIDGNGRDLLSLPKRAAYVSAVRDSGAVVALVDLQLADDGSALSLVSPLNAGSWVTRARRSPLSEGPAFRSGRANIEITGIWGWTDVEYASELGAVTNALRFHMEDRAQAEAHKLAATVRAARGLGLTGVRQGNLSFEIGAREPALSARAQREVSELVWSHAVGVVV